MLVSAIAAVARNGVIGRNNGIPWHLPADLAYFKRTTMGHCVIMGRTSFESIGRPLPKRTNIVVTRSPFWAAEGVLVAHSVAEALRLALNTGDTEAFIIGGGELYRQSLHLWDRLYLTEVDVELEGDVFFPSLDFTEWREIRREEQEADDRNPYRCVFRVLERIGRKDKA